MKRLCTYSMVRTYYDRGQDYIDSFWPFVVSSFTNLHQEVSYQELQRLIQEKTTLLIPLHPLKTIVQRAKRKGYLDSSRNSCRLNDNGREYKAKMEQETDAERRINECLDDLQKYFREVCQKELGQEEIGNLLTGFIQRNIEYFLQFVIPAARTIGEEHTHANTKDSDEIALVRYLLDVDKKKPAVFVTMKDIICGSIISFLLQSEALPEATRRIEKTRVFLDTNLVFSILGLHFPEFNNPAKELLDLLKREKVFQISVFDFTLQEIIRVLSRYSSFERFYFPGVKVATIYSSLKSNGWTATRVRELIVRIEDDLEKCGIAVVRTGINLNRYTLDQSTADKLHEYKPAQSPWNQGHDLEVIKQISLLRRGDVRRIEEAKCIFLTADTGLAKYNYNESGHRAAATVCEVVPDRLMANLLWLKDPRLLADMPLRTIIAIHSRDLFVDRNLWQAFHDTVAVLRKEGRIGDEDVAVLLYDQQLVGYLQRETSRDNVEQPAWVLERLEEAKKRMEVQQDAKLDAMIGRERSVFATKLTEVEQSSLRMAEERFLKSVAEAKSSIRDSAEALAGWIVKGLAIASCGILGWLSFWVGPKIAANWVWLEPWSWLVGIIMPLMVIILSAVGWRFDVSSVRSRLQTWLSTKIFLSNLRQSQLEKLVVSVDNNASP